jgi:electron transfer flavoprotein beta subunit
LAKGADRAIRIDPGDSAPDVLAVARLLSLAFEREQPDLVFCGVQSSDAVNGATGVALAGYAGLPHVAVVRSIAWDEASAQLDVDRELEGGLIERLRVKAPALLTIQTGINEPRYANLRAIKQARQKPMEVLEPADLGVDDLGSFAGARVVALSAPSSGARAEILDGDAGAVAARIAEIVKDAGVAS